MERAARQTPEPGAGYLCFQSSGEEGGEWAALLVVSSGGLPIEFLYSGPLRPTPVQEILYQERLAPEVRLSLIRALVRGLRARPVFVAGAAEELDAAFEREFSCPLLSIVESGPRWSRAPGPPAEALLQRLEDVVGVAEPLGRARAALAYVVEYEQKS